MTTHDHEAAEAVPVSFAFTFDSRARAERFLTANRPDDFRDARYYAGPCEQPGCGCTVHAVFLLRVVCEGCVMDTVELVEERFARLVAAGSYLGWQYILPDGAVVADQWADRERDEDDEPEIHW